jgi:hypothetical protein
MAKGDETPRANHTEIENLNDQIQGACSAVKPSRHALGLI